MYANELFEQSKPRVVVTYPGRFQPFHQGHAGVFAQLQKKFGNENVFILTSNDTSSAKSPFNFSDKYQLMTAAGVPGNHIRETNAMYALPADFDPYNTIFITAVGAPDADRLNPDSYLKRDKKDKDGNVIKPAGSPGYYKTWGGVEKPMTADEHGYVVVIPEIHKDITINGQKYDVSHGTDCRNLWNQVRNDPKTKSEFLSQLYGRPDKHLADIFDKIPAPVNEDVAPTDSNYSASPIHGQRIFNEFAPDEGGGSRKFIPWTEFIEQVKQIVGKDFSCKENIVKSTIKARFIPHDPMEYGPTMLYSYYETRAGGRNKGAISTRGSIQVGKYTKGGLFGHTPDQLLTGFHLLKGHPFERHFDLTFDNIYKIANIILGNTEGALEFKPENVAEAISRRGFLKGAGAAAAAGAAGKASAIAGAFPTPSHQQAMYKAAADSNAAQARADAAEKAKRDAQRLKQGTSDIERLNKINFHGGKVIPINATWDGDSDFMDVDGTKYAMASRMPIRGDEPGNMKLVSTKEGRQVYMWTRNSLKGVVGRYFYPAPAGSSQINEFAPGNGDDGLPHAEYQVYQCNPEDQFDWIGGPLYQTDSMGMAHKYAYEQYIKHRPKAFMVWQERSQGSRGNYGVKGESDHDEDRVNEGKFNELSVMLADYHNSNITDVKFYGMYGKTRQQVAKEYEQYLEEDASGVIASKKQAKDPRYSMSLTQDVRPGQVEKNLRAFRLAEDSVTKEDMKQMVKDFLPVAMKELGVKRLPRIVLQPHVESHDGQATFGRFDNEDERVYLGIANRHPVDILRTLAHELVHFKQHEDGKLYPGAGETGSPIENEAHWVAGIIMRHFNKKYPNAIKSKPLELEESVMVNKLKQFKESSTMTIEEKYSFILNEEYSDEELEENFADGRNPQDKGDSKRYGVPTKASVSTLRKVAKQGGRKGQLAHWMANMKAGKAKK